MTNVEPGIRAQVANRVQVALDRYQPRNYRVEVDAEVILRDGEWYHVVVKAPDDVRDRDFYDALANAESDLNDPDTGDQYLLVPAVAD